MAAPGATFRRLLLLSRSLPSRPVAAAAAAVRPYGVRASDTGELVTHTGQVRARGRGERRAAPGVGAAPPLPGEGGRVRAASPAVLAPAGKCSRSCERHAGELLH